MEAPRVTPACLTQGSFRLTADSHQDVSHKSEKSWTSLRQIIDLPKQSKTFQRSFGEIADISGSFGEIADISRKFWGNRGHLGEVVDILVKFWESGGHLGEVCVTEFGHDY